MILCHEVNFYHRRGEGFSPEKMAVAFTRFSCWIWSGKDRESSKSSLSSSSEFVPGFREPDCLKFPPANGPKIRSNSRKIKKKWQSREERRMDKEYDIVLVPSDGVCMSGSESDDSDWSIGWLEPHAPDFQSGSETENSFAVLVRCYGRGRSEQAQSSKTHALGALEYMGDASSGKMASFHLVLQYVWHKLLSISSKFYFLSFYFHKFAKHYLVHGVGNAKNVAAITSCYKAISKTEMNSIWSIAYPLYST